jgi:hypothetical protein
MNESEIKEFILARSRNHKMSCREAFEIAEQTGVSRKRIGQILNELEIKVTSCQLGCFK